MPTALGCSVLMVAANSLLSCPIKRQLPGQRSLALSPSGLSLRVGSNSMVTGCSPPAGSSLRVSDQAPVRMLHATRVLLSGVRWSIPRGRMIRQDGANTACSRGLSISKNPPVEGALEICLRLPITPDLRLVGTAHALALQRVLGPFSMRLWLVQVSPVSELKLAHEICRR